MAIFADFSKSVSHGRSKLVDLQFGVPQGSILRPVLISLYANDLKDILDCTAFQHADKRPLSSTVALRIWILLLDNWIG